MTKKDYVLIAGAVDQAVRQVKGWGAGTAEPYRDGAVHGLVVAVEALAFALALENPRFDRAKFVDAAIGKVVANV